MTSHISRQLTKHNGIIREPKSTFFKLGYVRCLDESKFVTITTEVAEIVYDRGSVMYWRYYKHIYYKMEFFKTTKKHSMCDASAVTYIHRRR